MSRKSTKLKIELYNYLSIIGKMNKFSIFTDDKDGGVIIIGTNINFMRSNNDMSDIYHVTSVKEGIEKIQESLNYDSTRETNTTSTK